MLTIAKLGEGQEDYYLAKVAQGVEDYYSGHGEAPGAWLGRGTARLGLDGSVAGGPLKALMAGVDPSSGERLAGRPGHKRVPGWDLTFSAPKSVSVLYGLGTTNTADDTSGTGGTADIAAEVAAAHDTAVTAGLAYLETHATVSRRRDGDQIVQVRGEGFVAAGFRHRTSRAGDPQLHTHVLVPNAVERIDGGWGALHSPVIYHHARTAGFIYQAVLRGELTQRLGVTWGEVDNGYSEIQGVSEALLEWFSKRRAEIQALMDERGDDSARAAQVAAYRTRAGKDYDVDPETLHQRWAAEAADVGVDPAEFTAQVTGHNPPHVTADDLQDTIDDMVSPHGLTAHNASFDRRDITRAWCQDLPPGTAVTHGDIENLVDDLLQAPDIIPVIDQRHRLPSTQIAHDPDGAIVTARPVEETWTTTEMLAVEAQLLDTATRRRSIGAGQVDRDIVDKRLAHRSDLGDDQVQMVRQVTTSGHGIDLVIDRAGSGKIYALAAAADIWRAGGYQPIGLGLAGRVGHELEVSAGIPSTTVARFLIDADHKLDIAVTHNNVIVVDEAAMVDTRRLDQLLTHAERAGAKVVLVGDHHQLPAVEAGGAFAALVRRLGATELTQNRRQTHGWERTVLDQLRHGTGGRHAVTEIIHTYSDHGRLHLGPTPAAVRAAMVTDWHTARANGHRSGMIALRRHDVTELNQAARALLIDEGAVAADGITIADCTFAAGDRVVCLEGDRWIGVHNALFATVTHTDPDAETVTIQPDNGNPITLPRHYLSQGHLDHAYATTIHKAQGATYDHTLLLGDERLYRQAAYTGLSRGRHRNDFYIVIVDENELDIEPHGPQQRHEDPLDRITRAVNRDGAKHLATTQQDPPNHDSVPSLAELWAERDQLATRLNQHPASRPPEHVHEDEQVQRASADQPESPQQSFAAHPTLRSESAQPPKPTPDEATVAPYCTAAESSISSEAAPDDETATADSAHAGNPPSGPTQNDRDTSVEPGLESTSSDVSQHEGAGRTRLQQDAPITTVPRDDQEWLTSHREQFNRLARLNRTILHRTRLAGHAAEITRPDHITELLGGPPTSLHQRRLWRDAAAAIESYQARWNTPPNPLDLPPGSPQEAHLIHVLTTIEQTNTPPAPADLTLDELA